MASQNPPRSSDDMILFALEQALREVWAVLKAHDPMGIPLARAARQINRPS
jgi:hypothetical protein